jgi:nucleotide-binding universal stress UspA family protein
MALPQHSAGPPGQVVVGVDGSPNSMEALRHALRRAAERGTGVEMIYVIPADAGPAAVVAGYTMLGAAGRCVAAAGLCVHNMRQTVVCGDPAEVLVKRSVGAQMLVVGGRFHSENSGNLLGGDVLPYVLGHAVCPVDICANQRIPEAASQPPSET